MSPEAIFLSIRDQFGGEGSYRFACPECRNTIEKPADRKVVALLLSAGVEIDDEPDLDEPTDQDGPFTMHPGGPPFTADDILAFHYLLLDDDALDQALQELR